MSVREFKIELDSTRYVFYPGEQITGNVVLSLPGPMMMRGITIEFEGNAKCHWTEKRYEGEGENRREVTDHIEGKEKYFQYKSCLFGVVSGGASRSHPYGHFKYPFVFNIPQSIPSSFEGDVGHIRYKLKAEINIPGKHDIKTKRGLVINEIVDTNSSDYRKSPGGQVHKDVGCLCWKSGPLELQANIDRQCYCPGEFVLFNAQLQNLTKRDVTLNAVLIQEVLFIAKEGKRKHETKVIARLQAPQTLAGNTETWSNKPMAIPACSSSISKSSIVKVSYVIKISVDVPWGLDPSLHLPIIIGTVPFMETYGQNQKYGLPQEAMPIPENNFSNTPQMPPAPPDLLGYPRMQPPAYSSPMGSKRVNIHKKSNCQLIGDAFYMPVYTFAKPYQGSCKVEYGTHQATPHYPPQPYPQAQPPIGFVPGPPQAPGYPPTLPPQQLRYPPAAGYAPHGQVPY